MVSLKKYLKSNKTVTSKEDNKLDDTLIELSNSEAENIMAVGNSIQSSRWFVNEDMNYLINKKKL